MNGLHNLDMSTDFWWAISGSYAILAERVLIEANWDPRFLNDLNSITNIKSEASKEKIVSSVIINSIGRQNILDKNFSLNIDSDINKDVEELIVDDEEKHFLTEMDTSEVVKTSFPMKNLTNFIESLRLKKLRNLYLKIIDKIKSSYQNQDHHLYKNFQVSNSEKNFNAVLLMLLPDDQQKNFPKWFVWLSNYLVTSKHKWITRFGTHNIYQTILIAKSYQKFGVKNIKIIPHGVFYGVGLWHLYRFSLFPNMKLSTINQSLNLTKKSNSIITNDILFCPMQLPYVCDFFSYKHYWDFMEIYKKTIKLMNEEINRGKNIKIRYKNFKYLSGFSGPFTIEECKIPNEEKRFEDIYNKYKLIVSMPFGSIAAKCYKNNLNSISFHYPFFLTDRNSYLKIKNFQNVFTEGNKFLEAFKSKIKEL